MTRMIAVAVGAALLTSATAAGAATISGAGATAPAPIYQKWAEAYRAKTGVGLNYQGIGSGGGIKQIEAKTVDFGASDKPLAPADLASHGLMQFPTVIVGITPVVNLPGVTPGEMHLTGPVLAQIYLGAIKRWTDPADRPPEPRQAFPQPADHRGAPFRRVGHDLPLHLLPEGGQPGLGDQGRRQRQRAVAGRPGRQGQ